MAKSYYNVIEVLVNICTADGGKLKIFLKHIIKIFFPNWGLSLLGNLEQKGTALY